jgi:hypothetical protein
MADVRFSLVVILVLLCILLAVIYRAQTILDDALHSYKPRSSGAPTNDLIIHDLQNSPRAIFINVDLVLRCARQDGRDTTKSTGARATAQNKWKIC